MSGGFTMFLGYLVVLGVVEFAINFFGRDRN